MVECREAYRPQEGRQTAEEEPCILRISVVDRRHAQVLRKSKEYYDISRQRCLATKAMVQGRIIKALSAQLTTMTG